MGRAEMTKTVMHLAAHPDDELIGPPATLLALRDVGYRIVNVVCGLGRPDQHERRARELEEASRIAGFEAVIPDRMPVVSSRTDDAPSVHAAVLALAREEIGALQPEIVVSSTPHDRHPSHELVARALRDAVAEQGDECPRWWMWGLWSDLPMPTIGTAFGEERLEEILTALGAYGGELERNDYRELVRGRALMNAALGPELLFGFGSDAVAPAAYVELITEVGLVGDRWMLGSPRWLDAAAPLAPPGETDITSWLLAASVSDTFGPAGSWQAAQLQA